MKPLSVPDKLKQVGSLRVGYLDYELRFGRIVRTENSTDTLGFISQEGEGPAIDLADNMNDQMAFNTVWHEVVHALFYLQGSTEHDEQMVDALATGICMVLRDNPVLGIAPT